MQIFYDTLLIFRRSALRTLRSPVGLVFGLIQPFLYLALFGPLVKGVAAAPGFPEGDPWAVFVPGLLVQLGLFGTTFVGFGLIAECRSGVVERLRVTPASRLALLLGRVLRDASLLLAQSLALVLAGFAFGLRAPVGGVVLGLGLVVLQGVAVASLSYAAALALKSEDAYAPLLSMETLPLLLLSGVLLPMSLAPPWLDALSRANPLRYVVDAVRAAFQGRYATGEFGFGLAVAVVLAAAAVSLGVRTFRRESA